MLLDQQIPVLSVALKIPRGQRVVGVRRTIKRVSHAPLKLAQAGGRPISSPDEPVAIAA
jgi:hypothetical protein